MNPVQLLASLGLALTDLNLTTAELKVFRELGSIWSSWQQAQSYLRSIGATATATMARKAFNIANYFAFQSEYLKFLAPNSNLPRQMAEVSERSVSSELAGANYRYDVAIDVTFTDNNNRSTYYIHIDSPYRMSNQGAINQALGIFNHRMLGQSPNLMGDEGPSWEINSVDVVGFFRYPMGE